MNIESAIKRIYWRFSKGTFTPNQNDIDSIDFITDWINRTKEKEIQEYTLFVKMYVYCFMHEVDYYKDIKFAQQRLHELCKMSVPEHYKKFTDKLNHIELEKFTKAKKINTILPNHMSLEDIVKEDKLIFENQNELKRLVLGHYDTELVKRSLNNQVTEAINKYRMLP